MSIMLKLRSFPGFQRVLTSKMTPPEGTVSRGYRFWPNAALLEATPQGTS